MIGKRKIGVVILSFVVLIAIGAFVWTSFSPLTLNAPENIPQGVPSFDIAFVEPLPSNPTISFVNNVVVAAANSDVRSEQVSASARSIGGKIVGRTSLVRWYYIEVESQTEESLRKICEVLMNTGLFSNVRLVIIDGAGIDPYPFS